MIWALGGQDVPHFDQSGPPAADAGPETSAVVKWFNAAKGFGFVSPVNGAPDAFLHISVLNRAGLQTLDDGAVIQCAIEEGPKGPQVTTVFEVTAGGAERGHRRQERDEERPLPFGTEDEVAGTVKWFKADKGFGFIVADDGAKDVFIHKSVLRRAGVGQLEAGQRVHVKVMDAAKGREATWLALL